MCVSSHTFFLWRRLNSSSRFPCRRRALRLLLFACSFFFLEPAWRLFSRWRGKTTEVSLNMGNITVIFLCVWSVFKEHASSFRHSVNNKGSKQHDGKRNTSWMLPFCWPLLSAYEEDAWCCGSWLVSSCVWAGLRKHGCCPLSWWLLSAWRLPLLPWLWQKLQLDKVRSRTVINLAAQVCQVSHLQYTSVGVGRCLYQ